ncbi:MAG: hypothetical protein ACFE95_17215 [Candidatus Hodarchaeota archaeon]
MEEQKVRIMSISLITSSLTYWFGVVLFSSFPSSNFFVYWNSIEWLSFLSLYVPLTIIPCSVIASFLSREERTITMTNRLYYLLSSGFDNILYQMTFINRDVSSYYVQLERGIFFFFLNITLFPIVIIIMTIIASLTKELIVTLKVKASVVQSLKSRNPFLYITLGIYYTIILYYIAIQLRIL